MIIIIIWRKDRKDKKGGGVMLMIKSKIKVRNVEYAKGKAALISAQIKTRCGESQNIVVASTRYRQLMHHVRGGAIYLILLICILHIKTPGGN